MFKQALLASAIAVSLSACGGGSSSDSSNDGSNAGSAINVAAPAAGNADNNSSQILTGRLVDSAVSGMSYETATQSGVTDSDGAFSYMANETVTFSLGGIELPGVEGADVITPLSIFSTDDILDNRVANLARLLQSLDADGNAENGIDLSDAAAASATGLSVDFASPNFDSQVINLVANSGSTTSSLIDAEPALIHLQETLFVEGIEDRSPPPGTMASAPDPSNTSSHPLVGTTAQFTEFSHDIAGTVTILDDRTIEVSNFVYDGQGLEVFFYLGRPDPDLPRGSDFFNGIEVGPQLRGRPFNGETITLTLPDNITLDDINGISVWCVPFGIDFGSAIF